MLGIEHDFISHEYFKFEAREEEQEWESRSEYRIGAVECGVNCGEAGDD